jgi:signal transduction histidine kinase
MAPSPNDDLAERLRDVRHDIRNQLSNINLLIDQLKYELKEAPQDQREYLDMLENSIEKIDFILKSTE